MSMFLTNPSNDPGSGAVSWRAAAFRIALAVVRSRPLARRNVRQGMDVRQASWHAVQGVAMFNAIGMVVIWWCLTCVPLMVTVFDDRGVIVNLARLWIIAGDSFFCWGFAVAGALWAQNNPALLTGWRRTITRPIILVALLFGAMTFHIVGIIATVIVTKLVPL